MRRKREAKHRTSLRYVPIKWDPFVVPMPEPRKRCFFSVGDPAVPLAESWGGRSDAPKPEVARARSHGGEGAGASRWAMLIKHVYEVDPLTCPDCGEQMKVVSLIEARQQDVVQRILKHAGLLASTACLAVAMRRRKPCGEGGWVDPPLRSPPQEPLRQIVREPFYDDWVSEQVKA